MFDPLPTVGGALLAILRSAPAGGGETVDVVEAVLFETSVSGFEEVTTPVLISEDPPGAVTLTTIVTRANPGFGSEPRLATTVPLEPIDGPTQLPWLVVQDWKVVPTGSGSVTTTPVAVPDPGLLLVTPSVYVRVLPDVTGLGEAFLERTRSTVTPGVTVGVPAPTVGVGVAPPDTTVVALAWLLAVFVSGVSEETTAVLVIVVPEGAVTVVWIVRIAKPGELTVPRAAVTLPPDALQVPCVAVQETNVTPPGSASSTTTLVAALGPPLLTWTVYVRVAPDTTGFGEPVLVRARSAPGLQGSWYWNVPAADAEQVVSEELTETSTGLPTLISVPAVVPAGQAGAVAPLSGIVTTTAVAVETMGAGLPPTVTLVMLLRLVPVIVTDDPGGPEAGLTETIVGLVMAT